MKHFNSFRAFSSELLEFINSSKDDADKFNELALALFQLQFENVSAYRKVCQRALGDSQPSHWSKIPAVPTSAFKDFELTSLAPEQRTHVFHSSGTTEQRPSRHFHNDESLAVYEVSLMQWFSEKFLDGAKRTPVFVSLTPEPSVVPHSSLAHMFGTVAREHQMVFTGSLGPDGAWVVDAQKTIDLLGPICRHNDTPAIVGTAFGFVHLLDYMAAANISLKLPAGALVMETGGYKGRSRVVPKPQLHKMICDGFGISQSQIISEYGMSELSSQAYDNPDRIFRFPPWARVQIISPETGKEVAIGEAGLVRIFDLANVYSVQAIQTEDLAIRRDTGFELLGRPAEAEPRGCSLMATDAVLR